MRQGKPQAALEVYERARELNQSMVERESDEASRCYDLAGAVRQDLIYVNATRA